MNFGLGSYLSGQLLETVLTVGHASNAIFIIEQITLKPDVGEYGQYLS
jgi:hypothetical protein